MVMQVRGISVKTGGSLSRNVKIVGNQMET